MARKASSETPQAAPTQVSTHSFKVDVHIIRDLIGSQAGSLEKAIMEAVSNSMDAGASSIQITANANQVTIQDNGKGIPEKQEIFDFFATFGFDHSKVERSHGRFGIGRGQLFCYGVNSWRTGTFDLKVDINHKGLDFDLAEGLPAKPGMQITIDLYQKLGAGHLYQLEENLRRLIKFSTIPVTLNGKPLSEAPQAKTWPHETKEAWFDIRTHGDLMVYSQGLLVQNIGNYRFGIGGVVVTKPGHALKLNMARNDIHQQDCQVWKVVSKTLNALAAPYKDKAVKQNTLTSSQRKSLAQSLPIALAEANGLMHQSKLFQEFMGSPLFTLTNNKHISLSKLLERPLVAIGPTHDKLGDKAIQRAAGWAVADETLDRFGVTTLADLKTRLHDIVKLGKPESLAKPAFARPETRGSRDESIYKKIEAWRDYDLRQIKIRDVDAIVERIEAMQTHETTQVFKTLIQVDFEEISVRDLKPDEKVMLQAIRKVAPIVRSAVDEAETGERWGANRRQERQIRIMRSDTIDGCTDGSSVIWLERKFLNQSSRGLKSFMNVVFLLAHEYVHGNNSQNDHGHDQQFFETFHDTVRGERLTHAGIQLMGKYARGTKNKPSLTLIQDVNDLVDPDGQALFQGEDPVALLDDEPAPTSATAPSPPAPAKRRRAPRS